MDKLQIAKDFGKWGMKTNETNAKSFVQPIVDENGNLGDVQAFYLPTLEEAKAFAIEMCREKIENFQFLSSDWFEDEKLYQIFITDSEKHLYEAEAFTELEAIHALLKKILEAEK